MFEEHPVPQNISSYQFRLVGDMTIKQFFQLAGGALISLIIYASPLPNFLKWPFIIFFTIAGAALAFLPLQERPLEEWVIAFFRSVYSPTIYKWGYIKKEPTFAKEITPTATTTNKVSVQIPSTTGETFLKNLEEAEEGLLGKITSLFSQASQVAIPTHSPLPKPSESVSQPNLPPILPIEFQQTEKVHENLSKPAQDVKIPKVAPIQTSQKGFIEPNKKILSPLGKTESVNQTLATSPTIGPAQKPQFSPESSPPIAPTQPNVVVGQVMDSGGKIVESAILEIKDPFGRPVRALKTNKAGHFLIVTPLTNGKYKIFIEKEGLEFDPVELEANGSIIPPIAIKAKNALSNAKS